MIGGTRRKSKADSKIFSSNNKKVFFIHVLRRFQEKLKVMTEKKEDKINTNHMIHSVTCIAAAMSRHFLNQKWHCKEVFGLICIDYDHVLDL